MLGTKPEDWPKSTTPMDLVRFPYSIWYSRLGPN